MSNRPAGAPAPREFPLGGTFVLDANRQQADVYKVPLPIPRHLLPSMQEGTHSFGTHAPTGLVIRGPVGPVPFERKGRRPGTWGYDEEFLYVGVPLGGPPPVAEQLVVEFPKATATEDQLNFGTSGLTADAFARRTMTIGKTSYTGLYLPPPSEARFALTVPASGRLTFTPRLLPPSIPAAAPSDGAHVEVVAVVNGAEQVLRGVDVGVDDAEEVEVDLSSLGGQAIELVLRTSPGASAELDYLLLASPMIYAPSTSPRRVVVVFVDTLRPDHLGFAGYDRPTSPTLDKLAKNGTVFSHARAIAPWTLPSARALLTGREPEEWAGAQTLAEALGASGFHTDAIVTNAFLSQPFDLQRGWDLFQYAFQLPAADVVARAVEVLETHQDQDELLLVHFMEPHLPYQEPVAIQGTWAQSVPDGLPTEVNRTSMQQIRTDNPNFPVIHDYVVARYDQEILALDQALPALFAAAGPTATVVLVSDHGEELWDHGGFEHGHSFYDELLHVPLVIRSPHLPIGTVSAPVSLLDVLPTICEISGAACPEVDGTSLVPVAWADAGAADALTARPVAFGRPLYGKDGWGVLSAGKKWWDRGGVQVLYDVVADPSEETDLAGADPALSEYPSRLAATLGRPVRVAWRIDIDAPDGWRYDLGLYVSHPHGFAEAWIGFDPRSRAADIPPVVREGRVSLEVPAGHEFPRTVWVVPSGDPYDVHGTVLSLTGRGVALLGVGTRTREPGNDPPPILTASGSQFRVTVELGFVPTPTGGEVGGYSEEMESELRALGYLDGDD